MKLLALLIGIIFLLVLIIRFKINTFVALVLTAAVTALLLGMPMQNIATSIETGIGGQLGGNYRWSLVLGGPCWADWYLIPVGGPTLSPTP